MAFSQRRGRRWLARWFGLTWRQFGELRREDVVLFAAWVFFSASTPDDLTAAERRELEGMVHSIEAVFDSGRQPFRFPPGRSPGLVPMRISKDPVRMVHRRLTGGVLAGVVRS